ENSGMTALARLLVSASTPKSRTHASRLEVRGRRLVHKFTPLQDALITARFASIAAESVGLFDHCLYGPLHERIPSSGCRSPVVSETSARVMRWLSSNRAQARHVNVTSLPEMGFVKV